MKAVAVRAGAPSRDGTPDETSPGVPDSVHLLTDEPGGSLSEMFEAGVFETAVQFATVRIAAGGGVSAVNPEARPMPLVEQVVRNMARRYMKIRVLAVGVDATDQEINEGLYGLNPFGKDRLIVGHECVGVVEEVGADVAEFKVGDLIAPMVRLPGPGGVMDAFGYPCYTELDKYIEHGICLQDGFLREFAVVHADWCVKVAPGHRGFMYEPLSIAEHAFLAAEDLYRGRFGRRPGARRPRVLVVGMGQIGQLVGIRYAMEGWEVWNAAHNPGNELKKDLVKRFGSTPVFTKDSTLENEVGGTRFDVIVDASGNARVALRDCPPLLLKNGVLLLTSITGGKRTAEIEVDRMNIDFVLGNKILAGAVNAEKKHFLEAGRTMSRIEQEYPGWMDTLLTTPIHGLENYERMFEKLAEKSPDILKVYVEVGDGGDTLRRG